MRVLLSWLREFLPPEAAPVTAAEAAERLTMAGLTVAGLTAADDDAILDLDLTTNRPDALGHYGVARELAAASGACVQSLAASQPALSENGGPADAALRVTIETEDCARYCARVLEGQQAGPGPALVRQRLEALGQRAIHPAADLTNYTLWELGHPTHAFDATALEGGEIRVRRARRGETLVTLDEIERQLDPEDLVIADARKPVALAGVMGGLATAVGPATRQVVIESAWFAPARVRRTAQRHGLHTEASHRFERGADPEICGLVADRIAARWQQASGGVIRKGLLDVYPRPWIAPRILLRAAALRRLLGIAIEAEEARRILAALGLQIETSAAAGSWELTATPPSWRPDLKEEVDLVEEIARIHGYAASAPRLPVFAGVARPAPGAELEMQIRQQLRGQGYAEALALSFAAESECRRFDAAARPVKIQRPISEAAAILRTSALPAMVSLLAYNLNRGQAGPRLFEIGKIYRQTARTPPASGLAARQPEAWAEERRVLTLGAAGRAQPVAWAQDSRPFDFFDLKAAVESVLGACDLPPTRTQPLRHPAFHPGRAAEAVTAERTLARYGQLHPELAAEWKLKTEIYLAELDLEALFARGPRPAQYAAPPRFPASERDFSFFFADSVSWAGVQAALAALRLPALAAVWPVEVFRGGAAPPGEHSLLLRARFQLPDRTLRDEEVAQQAGQIIGALTALGGRQR